MGRRYRNEGHKVILLVIGEWLVASSQELGAGPQA
jgi:hypothetical protein